jgi:hypothetical protein
MFIASDKYQLDHLKALCEFYFKQTISIETAASILLLSKRHNADALKHCAMDFMMMNASKGVFVHSGAVLDEDGELWKDLMIYAGKNYSFHPRTGASTAFSFGAHPRTDASTAFSFGANP